MVTPSVAEPGDTHPSDATKVSYTTIFCAGCRLQTRKVIASIKAKCGMLLPGVGGCLYLSLRLFNSRVGVLRGL